jgi:hypothetical protein
MRRTKRGLQTMGVAAAVFAGAAAIQLAAAQVSVDVSNCVELSKPEERLACFEAQVEASRSAPAAGAPPAAASSAAPDDFGFPERDDDDERESPPDVVAKVAELRETVPNAYLITLDNGQVWRQTQAKFGYLLRPGYDVRVYSSRWRSFRLTSRQLPGYIQVERVR